MSKMSSAETPTFNQNHNHHHQQQYTTKALVVVGGTQKTKQPPPPPPPRSSASNTSMSFNVSAADPTMNHNNNNNNNSSSSTCANVTLNKAHATLTPSVSTSSSESSASQGSSASISASTSAAVHNHHHQHHNPLNSQQKIQQQKQQQQQQQPFEQTNHHQQHSYSVQPQSQHYHQNVAGNIENGYNGGRPSTSVNACNVSVSISAGGTPNSVKRHTDIVCSSSSSSSSCCSSSASISATVQANAAVTPTVVNSGPLIAQKMSRTPSDKINLRLILVSGKTKEFLFNPSDSAGDIAQTVFDNWPEDWEREAVSKAEILRLIYQGRFLHCNVTLGALGLPLGKTTVMHLVPRDNLPEPNSQDQRQKSKGGSSRCCSTTCCIL